MYYIKLSCYDARGFIDIRVVMIKKLRRHYVFYSGLYQDFSSEIALDCLYLP